MKQEEEKLLEKIANMTKEEAKNELIKRGEEEYRQELAKKFKKQLEELEKELLQRKEQLQKRKQTLKPEKRDKHQINILEPEARLMPKDKKPGYNSQAAVDTQTHLIVATDVTDQPNDQGQFRDKVR